MLYLENLGTVGIPLFVLSFIGIAVIFERLIFFTRLPKINDCPLLTKMEETLQNNSQKPKMLRDELAGFLLMQAKKSFESGIRILRVISVTSPMLGLLGTVIGIIASFKTIAAHEGPVYPALIADGLWTAMLTTAVGLIIALPCLLAAFFFSRAAEKRIESYQNRLNKISFEQEGVTLD